MILEVLSYSWQVHHGGHTNVVEEAACANSRDLKNLRRVERASSHDSFAVHRDGGRLCVRRCSILFSLVSLALYSGDQDECKGYSYLNSSYYSCTIGVLNNELCD